MTDRHDSSRRRALAQLSAGSLATLAPWAMNAALAQAKPLTVGIIYVGPRDDFGYVEECQYLNGVIAGHMSKSKKLGFVAAKPIPQVLKNINAFTMGARSVDPKITTTVIFTGEWSMPVKEAEATNSLADQGIDVFTMHVDSPKVIVDTAAKRGKMVCGYHASQAKLAPNAYLTGAEWNWLTAYKTVIDAAQAGKPHPNFLRGGLKDGFVKSSPYGSMVTDAAKKNAEDVRAAMVKGAF